jgi:hypothetical protein
MHLLFRWTCCLVALMPLLVPTGAAPSTRLWYAPDEADFANPERGFYYQDTPLWLGTEYIPQQLEELQALRAEGISLLRWYFVIDEFRQRPLDEPTLVYLDQQLDPVRRAGLKVIPRFAYNFHFLALIPIKTLMPPWNRC